jgi:plasmid stabilization system protein ParE
VIPYTLHSEADHELTVATLDYEARVPGLGVSFTDAVQGAITLIREYPELGSLVARGTRRILGHGFPYAIVYRIEENSLFVVAVAHVRRRPGYWRHREP